MFNISKVQAAMLAAYCAGTFVGAFVAVKPSLLAIVIVMFPITMGMFAIAGWAERK